MTTKKNIYLIDFLSKIEILPLNKFKLLKISGFSISNKNLKRQIFSRVPGKVVTLMMF